jgi:hypothetical protein
VIGGLPSTDNCRVITTKVLAGMSCWY